MSAPQSLRRRGSWLISAEGSQWQMHSVVGPLESPEPGREVFRVLTATAEELFVSRSLGERGLRELRLERVNASWEPSAPIELLARACG